LCQHLVRGLRWHPLSHVIRADSLIQQTPIGISWDNHRTVVALFKSTFFRVQSQVHHSRGGVWSVTMKAVVRKNRPNLALEIDVACTRASLLRANRTVRSEGEKTKDDKFSDEGVFRSHSASNTKPNNRSRRRSGGLPPCSSK